MNRVVYSEVSHFNISQIRVQKRIDRARLEDLETIFPPASY
jgi:hypothetical protein